MLTEVELAHGKKDVLNKTEKFVRTPDSYITFRAVGIISRFEAHRVFLPLF